MQSRQQDSTATKKSSEGLRLFHLTAPLESHIGEIVSRGVIVSLADLPERVSQRYHPEDAALDRLIWLTSAPTKYQGWAADTDKGTVRIEIDPNAIEAILWSEYGPTHFSPEYVAALNHPRFGDYRDWYVVENPIPRTAWLGISPRPTRQQPILERRHVKGRRPGRKKLATHG